MARLHKMFDFRMKKLSFFLVALLATFALGFSGCSDDDPENPTTPVIKADGISVQAEAGTGKLIYTVENPVEGQTVAASSDAAWLHDFVVKAGEIAFSYVENTGAGRTATVTLSYEGAASVKVSVVQAAAGAVVETISIEPTALSFTYAGGTESVTVTSSGDWTLTGSAGWVRADVTEGKNGAVVKFTADPMPEDAEQDRDPVIFTFACGEKTAELTVTQTYKGVLVIAEENKIFEIPLTGETVTVNLQTNIEEVEMVIPEGCNWVTPATRAMIDKSFGLVVAANDTGEDRSVQVTFRNRDIAEQVTINQAGTLTASLLDPIFRAFILDNYDDNGDGEISREEAEAVASINIDGSQTVPGPEGQEWPLADLESLAGIEIFPNLSVLALDKVTALGATDLTQNLELTSVSLKLANSLNSIELRNLPKLSMFFLERTSEASDNREAERQLKDVDFAGCVELTDAAVRKCRYVETFNISDSPKLAAFNMSMSGKWKTTDPETGEVVFPGITLDISKCPLLTKTTLFLNYSVTTLYATKAQETEMRSYFSEYQDITPEWVIVDAQ